MKDLFLVSYREEIELTFAGVVAQEEIRFVA